MQSKELTSYNPGITPDKAEKELFNSIKEVKREIDPNVKLAILEDNTKAIMAAMQEAFEDKIEQLAARIAELEIEVYGGVELL